MSEIVDEISIDDPRRFARAARLKYVSDSDPGISRRRHGRGFSYRAADGSLVDDDTRERINNLVIPPAWRDVWICSHACGHIQATGRDEAGRKQYIYHPRWEETRNSAKFERLIPFGEVLPTIRERYAAGLRKRTLGREKVLSAVIRLPDLTLIRIGNQAYTRSNKTFGLTTLRDRHVDFSGEGCVFLFVGKSGKNREVHLSDPRLARVVKQCRDVPGHDLFQYYDEAGDRCTVTSADVNAHLQEITGAPFTAKTFRTWGGTVHGAKVLHDIGPAGSETQIERNLVTMVKEVAQKLGNTPAVCRQYYIHPAISDTYRSGFLTTEWNRFARRKQRAGLDADENVVLHLLKESTSGAA